MHTETSHTYVDTIRVVASRRTIRYPSSKIGTANSESQNRESSVGAFHDLSNTGFDPPENIVSLLTPAKIDYVKTDIDARGDIDSCQPNTSLICTS